MVEFTFHDVFGLKTHDRAASIVAQLYRGQPVTTRIVAERLQMSLQGSRKALQTAARQGLVEVAAGFGWKPVE